MINLFSIIALGFFLGMRHATDADHVVAVTTIVSRQRTVSHAALIGALWGLGHTITILLVGSAIILFGLVIPARIGLTMELSVGLMLILLGILNLSGMMLWITATISPAGAAGHSHFHVDGDYSPDRGQVHGRNNDDRAQLAAPVSRLDGMLGQLGLYQAMRPLLVGIVHGLAGSAAVALLVLTTIRVPSWAIAYLLIFGVGTIAGMMLITVALALPFTYSEQHFARVNQNLAMASGLLSLAFGMFIVYQAGFVNGIFTSHPQWTPH